MKRLAFLLVALIALRASRAHAAPGDYAEGEKLYNAGRYLDAAEKFRAAYDTDADPAFLLDAAQAYRFGEDCAHSAELYRAYLEKVPDAPKIAGYIAEQDACVKAKPQPVEPKIDPKAPPPVPEQPGHARLIIGIASAAVGLGLAGLGYYEDGKLDDIVTRRSAAVAYCTQTNVCTVDQYLASAKPYDDLAERKQINGIVAYSLGGLALAAAAYLIVTAVMPDEEHLAITPKGTSAFATWSF